jgi:hypothetical protein
MKKILITLISISLLIPISAKAADPVPPTLAILDTAINTSLPIFKDKIVYEACVLEWNSCPNGKSFMGGPGSAVMQAPYINNNGFDHGTQMASAAILANPNIKIVFVRIIGSTLGGVRQSVGEAGLVNALNWVNANKSKFNIQAISMSQGNSYSMPGVNYCPVLSNFNATVKLLLGNEIPVFVPAGNESNYTKINWPACVPETISIGSIDNTNGMALYSNYDPILLDFVAMGTMRLTSPDGTVGNKVGTSTATQVAAAQYVALKIAKPNLNSTQILELMSKTSTAARSGKHGSGKLIDLDGALNG